MPISRRRTIGTLCDEIALQAKRGEGAVRKAAKKPAAKPAIAKAVAKPTAPAPSFASAFRVAFATIDRRNRRNLVALADMRKALPQYTRSQFDSGLRKLRVARQFTLNSFDGRHGSLSPEARKAAIIEDGRELTFVSRIDDDDEEPEPARRSKKKEPRFWIQKGTGSNPWWIYTHDESRSDRPPKVVRGFKTKRHATSFLGLLEGDKQAGRRWYREEIDKLIKEDPSASQKDIWARAAQSAMIYGIPPSLIGADPNTGRPL